MQLNEVMHDGQAYAGPGHGPVEPGAACDHFFNAFPRNTRPVIFDDNLNHLVILVRAHQNAALCPFPRIVEEVSKQILQIAVIDRRLDVGAA